jgi:acetoin utilization deacetylase AcuC-like enzyme
MKTITVTKTEEIIDIDSITFPCYTKCDERITKHFSRHVCITVGGGYIHVCKFEGTSITTSRWDEIVANKTKESNKKDFEDAYYKAIEVTKEFI